MVIQYALNINNIEQDKLFNEIRKKISKERGEKIDKYYREIDRIRCLYSEVILRYALFFLGIEQENIVFEYNSNGKPQLAKDEDIHFNISHSGDWIVCAISSSEVGVDVEELNDNQIMSIARRCLTDYEYKQISSYDLSIQAAMFYKYWTLKESFVKNTGLGMKKSFLDFEFVFDNLKIKLIMDGKEHTDYHFEEYKIDERHQVAICTKENDIEKCNIINENQLQQWIRECLLEIY